MSNHTLIEEKFNKVTLRPASDVMQIERLGAFRITYLSFLRTIMRKVMREAWKVERTAFELDQEGYGEAQYRIMTPKGMFTFITFSHELGKENRSDRVISEKWDVTFALCEGIPSEEKLNRLRSELPKQEFGRGDVEDLVWSRANKSERMFQYVTDSLINEQQPDPKVLAEVGYLLRTTAVYGNGKFGIAPYEKIKGNHSFSGSFQAQMFAVYMLRHFSFELIEHIASQKSPHAAKLSPEIKRFIGTGNATGLGMVPFLITHPRLLHQWIYIREVGLARVKNTNPVPDDCKRFITLLDKTITYFSQLPSVDMGVFAKGEELAKECEKIKEIMMEYSDRGTILGEHTKHLWIDLATVAKQFFSIEMQELYHTLLIELYGEQISDLENCMDAEENYEIVPEMTIQELQEIIEKQYSWVYRYDFKDSREKHYFWYHSVEKEEPRIGVRGEEPGDDREIPLNIAEQVQELAGELQSYSGEGIVTDFLIKHPWHKGIVKRIQSLNGYEYGEIQCNLLGEDLLPIYLLRCKLSFFGAERFDPKSNRWVRITLFQGAPLVEDIGAPFNDHWLFPQIPIWEDNK